MDAKGKSLLNIGPVGPNPEPNNPGVSPEYPTLIVMIAVLAIILLFCFWGAPGVRAYCQRTICYRCPMDEPRESSVEVEVREEEDHDFVVVTNVEGKNGQVPQETTAPQRPQ